MYSCMNTIGDMQIEMDFYGHYNEFENNHDFLHISETYNFTGITIF